MSSEARPAVVKFANVLSGRMWAVVGVPLLGIIAVLGVPGHWRQDARYLAVVAFASSLLFYRFWRMGARFDDHGVKIRGFLRTDRVGWPEVSHFADGVTRVGVGGEKFRDCWALVIVLRDGRTITVTATAEQGFSLWTGRPKDASPIVRAIAQVAARYQIPAELTGRGPGPLSGPQPTRSARRLWPRSPNPGSMPSPDIPRLRDGPNWRGTAQVPGSA
jgi:hypothetical protein